MMWNKSVVVVSGGSAGIGATFVKRFLEEGHFVVVLDKSEPSEESLGHEGLLFFEVDLSDISQIESLPVAEWMRTESTVATAITVINNVSSRHKDRPLEEDIETWNEAIATSLSGAFFLAQNAIKAAVGLRASVKILNISSILSSLVGKQAASYGVAKAGLEYLTKYFAVIGRELPIPLKSLGVAPGMIVQNRHMKKYLASENTDFREANERAQPGKPYATESDLADLVLWLTQDSPDFLNGQTVVFDGGLTLQEPLSLLSHVKSGL